MLPLIQLHMSRKAYFFAFKTSVVQMPSISVLTGWQRKLQTDPELLREAMTIIDEDNDFDSAAVRAKFLQAVKGSSGIELPYRADDVLDPFHDEKDQDEVELGVDEDDPDDLEDQDALEEEILKEEAAAAAGAAVVVGADDLDLV